MTIAAELAKRIVSMRYEDLPAEAVQWAKISFIDTIGCAFAGIDEPCSQIARRVLTTGRSGGDSLVWGTALRTAALDAAAIKGIKVNQLRGFFSENVFVLLPGESKEVMFAAKQQAGQQVMTDEELVRRLTEQLKVRSYNDLLRYV